MPRGQNSIKFHGDLGSGLKNGRRIVAHQVNMLTALEIDFRHVHGITSNTFILYTVTLKRRKKTDQTDTKIAGK